MNLIIAALAPVLIILFYIYFRDKYEKEPLRLLFFSLLAGAIIVLPVIFFEQWISSLKPTLNAVQGAAYDAFLVAGFVEEIFKYLALFLLIWWNKNFNEKFDGIVYAVFISLGFAAVENIMYVSDGGMNVALVRAFTAVPAHALFGVRMGYFFGIAKMYPEIRKANLIRAFFYPFMLHGIYDFILMAEQNWLLLCFIPYVGFLFYQGLRKIKVTSDSSVFKDSELEI